VDYELKRAKTARYRAKAEFIAAKLAERPLKTSAETNIPTIHGVLPAPVPKVPPRATLDAVKYRIEAKEQGAATEGAVTSTSGGVVGKLSFDGTSNAIVRKRKREDGDGDSGVDQTRIGSAARKKKRKNKKINARRARQA